MNDLRKLAEAANERDGWYPAGVMWDVLIEAVKSQTAAEDSAFIAAASPDVVLGLLTELIAARAALRHFADSLAEAHGGDHHDSDCPDCRAMLGHAPTITAARGEQPKPDVCPTCQGTGKKEMKNA